MSMKKFFYRVMQGESVLSIAQKFSIPPTRIVKENCLKEEVSCGDLLLLESFCGKTYKVKPFDTIKSVAQKFGVSEEYIIEKNGVSYLFYGLIIYV